MSRRSGRSKPYSDQPKLNSEFPEDDEVNNYEAEAEDDLDEEQEVTRCICGQEEVNTQGIKPDLQKLLMDEYQIKIDQGLFIQCDKCSVWQHGYCVGLFINEDVPEKYWCEICKPDLHIFIYDSNDDNARSLYKPVNDKRKTLLIENSISQEANNKKRKAKRQAQQNASPSSDKHPRKERRHHDNSYDEQLQQALRESAKESGILYDTKPGKTKRKKSEEPSDSNKKPKPEADEDQSNVEDNEENVEQKEENKLKKSKIKSKNSKSKNAKSAANSTENSSLAPLSKDELINQASKPRYVNEKSSIYELRKRTGAILEWLGRSQLELEEEKVNKIELFSYKDKMDLNQQQIDNDKVINNFNENLHQMEALTEKILGWEQKYGKYAP